MYVPLLLGDCVIYRKSSSCLIHNCLIAMASGRGRPSKKPKLTNHILPATSLGSLGRFESASQVHHHRVFSLSDAGHFDFQTSYIQAATPSQTHPAEHDHDHIDPWNETIYSESLPSPDNLQEKCKDTARVSIFFALYSLNFSQDIEQDNTILSWLLERQTFVDEFIRLEGRGKAADRLCDCGMAASFRCNDCLSVNLSCQECIVRRHAETPFHRIKVCYCCFLAHFAHKLTVE